MTNSDATNLVLKFNLAFDGNYWVAKCPGLQMVAADSTQGGALMRAIRMFTGQFMYALNQDTDVKHLMAPGYEAEAQDIRAAVSQRRTISLSLECELHGAKLSATRELQTA